MIIIKTHSGDYYFHQQEVTKIQAISNYSKIFFTHEKPLVIPKVLHALQSRLGNDFIRINRSTVVNKKAISSIDIQTSNLVLQNGDAYLISRRRKKEVLDFMAL
jgi:DNA-binding LytR/AlgR family response regulator